jgi:methyl-accepting chemotaxis protein
MTTRESGEAMIALAEQVKEGNAYIQQFRTGVEKLGAAVQDILGETASAQDFRSRFTYASSTLLKDYVEWMAQAEADMKQLGERLINT